VTRVGVAYRAGLAHWIDAGPREIECVEITAEDFYKGGRGKLRGLGGLTPLLVRTRRLSLGTPGPLDAAELAWFASLVREAKPLWISEHLGFRCTPEIDLVSPVPVALTEAALHGFIDRAREVVDVCETPLLLENLASPLAIAGSMTEPEFLNRFCAHSGCDVLLDVTALLVNSRNHGFDPGHWLAALDPSHVVQIHIGGCTEQDGRWDDTHDAPIDEDLWSLAEVVLERSPVQAVILERDSRFPPVAELANDLKRLKTLCERGRSGAGPAHAH